MNLKVRAKIIRAMDLLARQINDEEIFNIWLMYGVADGDILKDTTDEELEYYCEDETYAELMGVFLNLMAKASKSGGLYSDDIVSK